MRANPLLAVLSRLTAPLVPAVAAALLAGAVPARADGLVAPADALGAGQWHARIEVDTRPTFGHWSGVALGQAGVVQMTRLLGDYHLEALRFGPTGVRLTSGVLLNQRSHPAAGGDGSTAWPYLGIGYAGAGARGDWGFSADVGLAATNPAAAARLGRVFGGTLALDDALRQMRLQPMIRFGVNYSF